MSGARNGRSYEALARVRVRPVWTEAEVRKIVATLRAEGIEVPRLRDEPPRPPNGQPRYAPLEGEA